MKAFFDTSVLVPVFLSDHPHHGPSLARFRQVAPSNGFAAAHSLAELYSTLTRLPVPYRLTPAQAMEAVRASTRRLTFVSLTADEIGTILEKAATLNIQGGTAYDFLIASCAGKAEIDVLYSWNIRHYALFGSEVRDKLRSPDQEASGNG
ncbi:MAG: PIN domain-containing protein [Bryobacteraceae bacterium]|nr:PIN domain-containing protein [Bryobacteraceae bacterium]